MEYLVTGKIGEPQTSHLDLQKIHKYSHLIDKIDALSEQQRKLVQTLVSELSEWE